MSVRTAGVDRTSSEDRADRGRRGNAGATTSCVRSSHTSPRKWSSSGSAPPCTRSGRARRRSAASCRPRAS
eukprot:596460-Pyramimonas_sp.AAC.1